MCRFHLCSPKERLGPVAGPRLRGPVLIGEDVSLGLKPLSMDWNSIRICAVSRNIHPCRSLIWISWDRLTYKDTGKIFPHTLNTIGQARNWRTLRKSCALSNREKEMHSILPSPSSFSHYPCSLYFSLSFSLLEEERACRRFVHSAFRKPKALNNMINIWPSTVLSFFFFSFIPPLEPEITFSAKGHHAQQLLSTVLPEHPMGQRAKEKSTDRDEGPCPRYMIALIKKKQNLNLWKISINSITTE